MLSYDTISQLIRISAYTVGGFFLGQAVVDGELFQGALSGVVSVGAFVWWLVVESKKPAEPTV